MQRVSDASVEISKVFCCGGSCGGDGCSAGVVCICWTIVRRACRYSPFKWPARGFAVFFLKSGLVCMNTQ